MESGSELGNLEETPIKKHFVTVTPLSKNLALVLFIVLLFVGGWVGYHFAPEKIVTIERVVEVQKSVEQNTEVGSLSQSEDSVQVGNGEVSESWSIYRNDTYGIEFKYPSSLVVEEASNYSHEESAFRVKLGDFEVYVVNISDLHPVPDPDFKYCDGEDYSPKFRSWVKYECYQSESGYQTFCPDFVYIGAEGTPALQRYEGELGTGEATIYTIITSDEKMVKVSSWEYFETERTSPPLSVQKKIIESFRLTQAKALTPGCSQNAD